MWNPQNFSFPLKNFTAFSEKTGLTFENFEQTPACPRTHALLHLSTPPYTVAPLAGYLLLQRLSATSARRRASGCGSRCLQAQTKKLKAKKLKPKQT
jgi:hypothetical protein